jgi:hypothetical protein
MQKKFGKYIVSSSGEIQNSQTGRILKQSTNQNGYKFVQLSMGGFAQTKSIHRLVYQLFVNAIPNGYEINHVDGDKSNNHFGNLDVVTKQQNMNHAVEIGLIKSGIENERSIGVVQIHPITNEVIEIFGSIRLAEKKTKIPSSSISVVVNDKGRKTAGGFKWKKHTS